MPKNNIEIIINPEANIAEGTFVIYWVFINSIITGIPTNNPKIRDKNDKKEKNKNGL